MENKMPGGLVVMKSDDDLFDDNVLVEVTDFRDDGFVEVAFDYDRRSFYLRIPLSQLLSHIAKSHGSKP